MGGEKCASWCPLSHHSGSPPHGRGKDIQCTNGKQTQRITPAWAGKSLSALLLRYRRPGSPPHGRGKVWFSWLLPLFLRITPAWAGKRLFPFNAHIGQQDHPRMGGEKFNSAEALANRQGSPPHGRGKVFGKVPGGNQFRITPAWAGKRLKRSHRSGIFISGPIPFHSVLHRPAGSGGSRAGRDGSPAGQPQNTGPA